MHHLVLSFFRRLARYSARYIPATVYGLFALTSAIAATPDAPGPAYALLSLVGDKMNVVTELSSTGSNLDRNLVEEHVLQSDAVDRQFLIDGRAALHLKVPDAQILLLKVNDPKIYATQDQFFDEAGQPTAAFEPVSNLLKNGRASRLVLITPHANTADISFHNSTTGHGKISGIGFYLDPNINVEATDSGERSKGYIAPYSSIRIRMIDTQSWTVLWDSTGFTASAFASQANANLSPWEILSPEKKTTELNHAIEVSITKAMLSFPKQD